jgi:hypothetical protein
LNATRSPELKGKYVNSKEQLHAGTFFNKGASGHRSQGITFGSSTDADDNHTPARCINAPTFGSSVYARQSGHDYMEAHEQAHIGRAASLHEFAE